MKVFKHIRTCFLVCGLVALLQPVAALGLEGSADKQLRDGQHDFDFNLGTWKSHIKLILHPFSDPKTYEELNGTVVVRKVWGGRAQIEEIEADGPKRHVEGLTLFLYNPESHQWSQNFANSRLGTLGVPMVGEFKDGRGEFFDQEPFDGRVVLVRGVWSDITPNSHRFEQSLSDDGGKSWQANWIVDVTRAIEADASSHQGNATTEVNHDFDFNFGNWKTHVSRLVHPLAASNTWAEYEGTSVVSKVWGGRASLFELEVDGPAGHIEGVGLRLFNSQSRQWSLNWASSRDGMMTQPMTGEFKNGRGEFIDQETFDGRAILSLNGFSDITPDSSRFEQAFSNDEGKTWETNWVMTFAREK